jgi:hypothetical protein
LIEFTHAEGKFHLDRLNVCLSLSSVIISFLDGLFTSLCHLFSKCLFSVRANVTDTGRSVTPENESEELSYQIIMEPTILDVLLALGTGMEVLFHATFANLAPLRPLVKGPA